MSGAVGGVAALLLVVQVSLAAAQTSPVDSLRAEVAGLDHVESVYAPLVKQLTDRGQPVVPLLLERLQSPRRLTALSAAWAIGKMGDERNLAPLMETWAKAMNETLKSESMTALRMTMSGVKKPWRPLRADGVDADVQWLLDACMCGEVEEAPGTWHAQEEDEQPVLFGDQLNDGYLVPCFEARTEIVQLRYPKDDTPAQFQGRRYISFHCEILDLADPQVAMPQWEGRMGGRPSSLALVSTWTDRVLPPDLVSLGGEGEETLWVKCGGVWRFVGVTDAMIS